MPDQKNDIIIDKVKQNDSHIMVEGSKRLDACGDTSEDLNLAGSQRKYGILTRILTKHSRGHCEAVLYDWF